MDRHICKAKRKDNGEWVQGHYVFDETSVIVKDFSYEVREDGKVELVNVYSVDPDTICNFIGYHDSHNNFIFENDIVEFNGASSHKYLVWYCREMSMITAVPLDGIRFNGYDYWNGKYPQFEYSTFCLMLQDPWGDFSDIKVIGNIIDNPELLEVYHEQD